MKKLMRVLKTNWALLIFVAAIAIIFGRTLFPPPGYMLFGDDVFRSYGFFREFFTQIFSRGTIPWWNPYLFSGTPFMANPSVAFLYPLNWLFLVTQKEYAFAWIFALNIFIASAGMYWMMGTVVKPRLSQLARIFAGIAFGFCGYFFARTWSGHTETLASSAWIPWVFGAFWQAFEEKRPASVVKASVFLAIQIFAGYQTTALFTLEAVGVAAVIYAVRTRSIRPFIVSFVGVVLGVLFASVQLLPNVEFFARSIRTLSTPYAWASKGSAILASFWGLVAPFHWGNQYTFTGPGPNFWEQVMYAGGSTIFLALTALSFLIKPAKEKGNRLLLTVVGFAIVVLSVWVSFGPNAPFNLHKILWDIIPMYKNIRFPTRHLILMNFALALMAGIGLDRFRMRFIHMVLIAVLFVELAVFGKYFITLAPSFGSAHDGKLVVLLSHDAQPYRYLPNYGVWLTQRDALDVDATPIYGIYSATGYDPSILRTYYDFADASLKNTVSSINQHDVQIPYLDALSTSIDFLNIKYVSVPYGYDPMEGSGKFILRYDDPKLQYKVYENLNVVPRFFMVSDFRVFFSRDEVLEQIRSGVDLTKTMLGSLDDDLKVSSYHSNCTPVDVSTVKLVTYGINDITLETHSTCDVFLSSSEVMYPGWKAYANGKEMHMFYANHAFRGIFIPKGDYTITMVYEPKTFMIGAAISILVAVVSFGIVFVLRKRST